MSLIADALRTAQQERERQQGAGHARHVVAEGFFAVDRRRRRRERRHVLVAVAAVLTVALGGLTFRVMQPRDAGIAAANSVSPAALRSPEPAAAPMAVTDPDEAVAVDVGERAEGTALPADQGATVDGAGSNRSLAGATPPAGATVARTPAPEVASTPPQTDAGRAPVALDEAPLGRAPPPDPAPGRGVELRVGTGLSGDFTELFAAALAAQQRGDAQRARDLYQQLVLARPQWVQAHSNLGTTYRALGDDVRAEASFRRALALDPNFAAAWSNLGMLLHAAGRDGEAIAALQHALELEPHAAGTRVNLATVMHASGLLHEARALLEEALGSMPLMPEAHYAMGRVLDDLGRPADAARHFDLFLVHAAGRFPHLEARVREHLATARRPRP
jgi:tetratricopeptide (TPR) repeat protein